MKTNSQLSVTLHLLLHLADSASPVTSQALAGAMHTNPVVIRRMIGGLREAGLVHSSKGHNGGKKKFSGSSKQPQQVAAVVDSPAAPQSPAPVAEPDF